MHMSILSVHNWLKRRLQVVNFSVIFSAYYFCVIHVITLKAHSIKYLNILYYGFIVGNDIIGQ